MPKNEPLRIIIDTNLWISFLISDKQNKIDQLLFYNRVRLLFSTELLSATLLLHCKIETFVL